MSDQKKPFKEGKFYNWIKEKFPKVLETVGDITGIEALNRVSDLLGGEEMSPEDRAIMYRLEMEEREQIRQFELAKSAQQLEEMKARFQRESSHVASTGKPDYFQWVVGAVALIQMLLVIIVGLFMDIKNPDVYHLFVGEAIGVGLTVVVYYYGSTKGSSEKTKFIQEKFKS